MRFKKPTIIMLSSIIVVILLTACGGSGGSNPSKTPASKIKYSGNTNPAEITRADAATMVDDILGAGDEYGAFRIATTTGALPKRKISLTTTLRQLTELIRSTDFSPAEQSRSSTGSVQIAAVPVSQVQACDQGQGKTTLKGALANNGTGTLTVSFKNCSIDGDRFNGDVKLNVEQFDFTAGLPVKSVYIIQNLSIVGIDGDFSMGGTLSSTITNDSEILTANVVFIDNVNGDALKTENFVVGYYYSPYNPTPFTMSLGGRLYDSQLGYVDVQTKTGLRFPDLASKYPSAGGPLIIQGSNGAKVSAIIVSARTVRLEVDVNGDSIIDVAGTIPWSNLGQVASPQNTPPVAKAGSDKSIFRNQQVTIDGGDSFDPDYNLINFRWSLVSKPAGSSAQLTYFDRSSTSLTPDLTGEYHIALIVNDGKLDSIADEMTVTAMNRPPVAAISGARVMYQKDKAGFSGLGSSDPEQDPLSYQWQVTQSPPGSLVSLTGDTSAVAYFSTDTPGDYTMSLTVTDAQYNKSSSHSFHVYSQTDFTCSTEQLYAPSAQGRLTLDTKLGGPLWDFLPLCDGWLYHTYGIGVTLVNAIQGFELTHWELPFSPTSLGLTADQGTLFAGGHSVTKLDISTANVVSVPLDRRAYKILRTTNDSALVYANATASYDPRIYYLDFQTQSAIELLNPSAFSIAGLGFDEKHNKLFISRMGNNTGQVAIDRYSYDSVNPSLAYDTSTPVFSRINGNRTIGISPDGNQVALVNGGISEVLDFDAATLTLKSSTWIGETTPAYSPDGAYIASIRDNVIYVQSVSDKTVARSYPITCSDSSVPRSSIVKFSLGGNLIYSLAACRNQDYELLWFSFRP